MDFAMNTTDITKEESCGTSRAAKILQVSVGTIHHMVEKGELKAWRTVRGHRRIYLSSVRNYLLKHRLKHTPEMFIGTIMKIVVLASDPVNLVKFKLSLEAEMNSSVDVTYFTDPMKMVLELQGLDPQLILFDNAALQKLGGMNWFSKFRALEQNGLIHIIVLSDAVSATTDELALAQSNKIYVVTTTFRSGWLTGYIEALGMAWELSGRY